MKILVPINNSVETIITELYTKVEVRLYPMAEPKTIEGELAIARIEQIFNQKIYSAVQSALKELEQC